MKVDTHYSIRLQCIDFSKPWWLIIVHQKWLAIIVFIVTLLRDVFWALEPFLVAVVLGKASWYFFAGAAGLWVLSEINLVVMAPLNARFQLQVIHSLLYSAHQHLLTIDPHYHVKRSSGVLLAKIERAAKGYEDVLDQITYSFAPIIIGIGTMIIILSRYSLFLTVSVCVCLFIMIGYGYYFARYACQRWENEYIQTDDDFKAAAFENLAQIHLVRASFATDYMKDKLTQKILANSATERSLWLSYAYVSRVLNILYTISLLLLIGFFLYQIQLNSIQLSHAIGIILAYLNCTNQIIKILQPFRRYMRGVTAITDLFASMQAFGKQTIPVFEPITSTIQKRNKSVVASDIVFGYGQSPIFDHHTLSIIPRELDRNHLYGIIGPSGVGKTTILSILGGQLRPTAGTVYINGIDIYAVNDATRRELIALQGQIATSVKGSVRYNLLFGLPQDHGYTDEYLYEVLIKVGLQKILQEHNGLETLLGEGALNISGGQRQRLNFAGLYLRAYYYKPSLILIDEPTSSLDEISEAAITAMIDELASHAITLVIAHRLKTLENAIGLIDLSLLTESKDIRIDTPESLQKRSVYYQKLLKGTGAF